MEENSNKPNTSGECICGCVGYGYVPFQTMGEVFPPEEGLQSGTIFPELSLDINEYGKVCKQTGGGM